MFKILQGVSVRHATWWIVVVLLLATAQAKADEPIKIGFGMALTGPLAANGKMSLVAMQIW